MVVEKRKKNKKNKKPKIQIQNKMINNNRKKIFQQNKIKILKKINNNYKKLKKVKIMIMKIQKRLMMMILKNK